MNTPCFETTDVLGIPYAELDYNDASRWITTWAHKQEHRYVVVAPVSSLIFARNEPDLADIFEHASLIASDGVPIVWARRAMGRRDASRLYGPDLMLQVIQDCAAQRIPIALVGGKTDRMDGLVREIERKNSEIEIAYTHCPPFRELSDNEIVELASEISQSGARVVFVAMGSPKQERLMARLRPHLPAVQIGVGAAFDFIPGYVRQAPTWVQRAGLEWAFRIACEPRRLIGRYASTIPPFVLGISIQIMQHHLRRPLPITRKTT